MTDDDTVPRYDWLERLETGLDDNSVGAVGGRDVVHHDGEIEEGWEPIVGQFTWYGKPMGNHHLGIGEARDVDFLKGCNYTLRRKEFKIPVGLLGSGAQLSDDLASCLEVRRAGYRAVYDPRIVVDHYPGERHDEDHRSNPTRRARMNGTFNEAYCVFSLAKNVRIRYLLFHIAVGDTGSPGFTRTLLGHIRREDAVTGRLLSTWAALIRAYRLSTVSPLPMWQPHGDSNLSFVSSKTVRLPRTERQGMERLMIDMETARWESEIEEYDSSHLRLRQVAKILTERSLESVFDIGCGHGHLGTLLQGIEYIGCDMIDGERASFPFISCNVNHDKLPEEIRDVSAVSCPDCWNTWMISPTFCMSSECACGPAPRWSSPTTT